jgi:DNA-binding transcriptional MerR regulator
MSARREWTLSEAARLLGTSQHRLIYLCEKGVIVPDLGDAEGRGSSRRFSARNLLEFSLALKLRELTIPVGTVAAIVHVLRGFEKTVAEHLHGFGLTEGLRKKGGPELRIIISDGECLYFTLGTGDEKPKLFGGIDFRQLTSSGRRTRVSRQDLRALEKFGGPEGSRYARVEIDVSRLARDLPLAS